MSALTEAQQSGWERDGFFFLRGFTNPAVCEAMYARIVELTRTVARGESIGDGYLMQEQRLVASALHPEDSLSKLFRVHRDEPVFRAFVEDARLLEIAMGLLGPDLDCFLSQFIAKHPGALGQPWHQDAFYFPFDRRPQVGLWLAITEAHEYNGPLWVLPGSHLEPVHAVVDDERPGANLGYVEIIDHDMEGAIPVPMQTGDVLVFHSHLMHMSTDNASNESRLAMVYHLADGNTVDQSMEKIGFIPPNIDWLPVLRGGKTPTEQ